MLRHVAAALDAYRRGLLLLQHVRGELLRWLNKGASILYDI